MMQLTVNSVRKRPNGRGLTEIWPVYEIQTCGRARLRIGGFFALRRQIYASTHTEAAFVNIHRHCNYRRHSQAFINTASICKYSRAVMNTAGLHQVNTPGIRKYRQPSVILAFAITADNHKYCRHLQVNPGRWRHF